eukprot:scaffold162830_cov52-Attheya_sp.AAC.7
MTAIHNDKCNSGGVVGVGKLIPKHLEVSPSHDLPDFDAKGGLGFFSNYITQMWLEQLRPSSSLSMQKGNKRKNYEETGEKHPKVDHSAFH